MYVFPFFIHFLNTLTPAVGFLAGYLHHRVHVLWQPKAVSEENKEKSQDHECEGQPLPLFTCVPLEAAQGTAAHSHRSI